MSSPCSVTPWRWSTIESYFRSWPAGAIGDAAILQRLRIEIDWHVGSNSCELAALARILDVRQQPFAVTLVLHFGRVRDQILERPVLDDQLARALFADAGHTLDVVDG